MTRYHSFQHCVQHWSHFTKFGPSYEIDSCLQLCPHLVKATGFSISSTAPQPPQHFGRKPDQWKFSMWQNLAEGEIQQQHLLRRQVVGVFLQASHHPVSYWTGGGTEEEGMEECVSLSSAADLTSGAVHCRKDPLKSFPHRKKVMEELPEEGARV